MHYLVLIIAITIGLFLLVGNPTTCMGLAIDIAYGENKERQFHRRGCPAKMLEDLQLENEVAQ